MQKSRASRAVFNNAVWCNEVCLVHDGATRFSVSAWWNSRQSPAHYPNLVTLAPGSEVRAVEALVTELLDDPTIDVFAVKDSFAVLDLAPLGFDVLFDASWLWREPGGTREPQLPLRWARVDAPEDLARWEASWKAGAQGEPAAPSAAFYPASLLQSPNLAFVAGYLGDKLVAGCALTRSDDVIGVSCSFFGTLDRAAACSDLVTAVAKLFPIAPLVSYEFGDDLAYMQRCGFETVGPLRVWLRKRADSG